MKGHDARRFSSQHTGARGHKGLRRHFAHRRIESPPSRVYPPEQVSLCENAGPLVIFRDYDTPDLPFLHQIHDDVHGGLWRHSDHAHRNHLQYGELLSSLPQYPQQVRGRHHSHQLGAFEYHEPTLSVDHCGRRLLQGPGRLDGRELRRSYLSDGSGSRVLSPREDSAEKVPFCEYAAWSETVELDHAPYVVGVHLPDRLLHFDVLHHSDDPFSHEVLCEGSDVALHESLTRKDRLVILNE